MKRYELVCLHASRPGGEYIEEVARRADRMIARIRLQDGNIVVFSRGHSLPVMALRWLGMDPSFGKFFPPGTSTLSVLIMNMNIR